MGSSHGGLLIGLLGQVEASAAGQQALITQPMQQALLGLLALSANRIVPAATLTDGLWQEEPSQNRMRNLHAHVYQLRRLLVALEPGRAEPRLVTRQPGYLLTLAPENLDLAQFTALTARGREAARAGDVLAAASLLGAALAEWRGPALAHLADISGRLATEAAALDEQRLGVQADYADAALAAGRAGELIADLSAWVARHPLRERHRAQLMLALYQSGRQAAALECYQQGRQILREDLGIEPGPDLKDLHQKILRADPALTPQPQERSAVLADQHRRQDRAGRAIPRQLPAGVRHFAGRDTELAELDKLLAQAAPSGTVVISAIGGTGGIGKTALALHWAHRVAGQFPDGQLHVNLRGFDPGGTPVGPQEALRGFLTALGVPAVQLPPTLDGQASLFRTLLADRRLLILLDNASDAAQVRPLLPAAAGCLVVVTSRTGLAGLTTTEGAVPLRLGLVSAAEAEALLTARLGAQRLAGEPAAVSRLIELCGKLPLALAIAAARAAANPALGLTWLVAQMDAERDVLDAFEAGDAATSVRAVFSWSVGQLSDAAARLFRLLGLHPGPDLTIPAAASAAGLPPDQARRLVAELVNASLLTELAPGRYAFHDLIRAYAAECAAAAEPRADRDLAVRRVLDHYLLSARMAGAAILGEELPLPALPAAGDPAVSQEQVRGTAAAIAWFGAEHQVLMAATALAERVGLDTYAWQLPCTMTQYFRAAGRNSDWADLNQIALAAAGRLGAHAALGRVEFSSGILCRITGAFDAATGHFERSLHHFEALGDQYGQASAYLAMSNVQVSRRQNLTGADDSQQSQTALGYAERALVLFRSLRDKARQARALRDLGVHHAALGELEATTDYCSQALELSLSAADIPGQVDALQTLGEAFLSLHVPDQAIGCFVRAVSICRQAGYPSLPPNVLEGLGDAHAAAGHLEEARAAWQEVMTIWTDQQRSGNQPSWRETRVLARVRAKVRGLTSGEPAPPASTADLSQ